MDKNYNIDSSCTSNTILIDEDANINRTNFIIHGMNNSISVGKATLKNVVIHIYGNNNTIDIDIDVLVMDCKILIYYRKQTSNYNKIKILHNTHILSTINIMHCDNSVVTIGKNTLLHRGGGIVLAEESKVSIGDDCLIASNVQIKTSDHHSITDLNGHRINLAGNITIGNKVWIAEEVTICKNAIIPSNSVVAFRSLVNKPFTQENILLAGMPAKIIRKGISWSRDLLEPSSQRNENSKLHKHTLVMSKFFIKLFSIFNLNK